MSHRRAIASWGAVSLAIVVPLALAAMSPLLAWRDGIYIAAGFAGIIGLGMLLVQLLLATGGLSGLSPVVTRRAHRWVGVALVVVVLVHIGGLWLTSPPDVIDALLFASPTPFSVWGVLAMWALLGTAIFAAMRRHLRFRPKTWRYAHGFLALVIAGGTIAHAMLIEGTMEVVSKGLLCAAVAVAVVNLMHRWVRRGRAS